MVYFALALFAEEDYEEVAARLTETLASCGCWDQLKPGGVTLDERDHAPGIGACEDDGRD